MSTSYHTILCSTDRFVTTITLNKPERKNPLGPDMINELCAALDLAKTDSGTRVVVVTGAGAAFSAGGDLGQMAGGASGPTVTPIGDYVDLVLRMLRLEKPIIARVPGIAMGGGLGLVAASHFAIGCESAILGTPEIQRGVFPMMITALLARVVPRRRLLEMMLIGDKLTAQQAQAVGLLSEVVPDASLDARVEELAQTLASRSRSAMSLGLRAFHNFADASIEGELVDLRARLGDILGTPDAREGLMSFLEKRKPSLAE